eukprot:jgi/Botrbrau1/11223/Bobra.0075s0019.1
MKEEQFPKEVPKPFTVPEGWKPPTMGEQWAYAARYLSRHPYANYGYAAVIAVGLLAFLGGGASKKNSSVQPPTTAGQN